MTSIAVFSEKDDVADSFWEKGKTLCRFMGFPLAVGGKNCIFAPSK
jgi:hypothetical protein